MKERYAQLEDNRARVVETNFVARNRLENQIQGVITERENCKQQISHYGVEAQEFTQQLLVKRN